MGHRLVGQIFVEMETTASAGVLAIRNHRSEYLVAGAHRPDAQQGDQVNGTGLRGLLLDRGRKEEVLVANHFDADVPHLGNHPLVQTTSATTTAICGNVVVVIVIVLGSFFLQVEATPINIVGYCVSTIAAIVYVGINLYQKKQQAALEAKSPVVGVAVK